MVTMAVPNVSKPFFAFVVQKCKLASRSFKLHVVGAVMCCFGHLQLCSWEPCWRCPFFTQVIFSSTSPHSTNPNAMPTEAASCFPNDNVIALTTSGPEREGLARAGQRKSQTRGNMRIFTYVYKYVYAMYT